MATRLNKKALYNRYIAGCTHFGLEPEFAYDDLTAKDWEQQVNKLISRHRKTQRSETIDSVKRNTQNAIDYVEQGVGEPLAHFRDRASALAKKLGKAVPIKIVRR